MRLPKLSTHQKLKIGDTIGVVAPSSPIIGDNIEELNKAKEIVERSGFKVKYSKNLFSNTNGYSSYRKRKSRRHKRNVCRQRSENDMVCKRRGN